MRADFAATRARWASERDPNELAKAAASMQSAILRRQARHSDVEAGSV